MNDIKISNIKQKKNSFSYDETFDITINGEKYFCTKEDIKDLSYSITLKDKDNHIVIEDCFSHDLHVNFWIDKHEISKELYDEIRMNEHFSKINYKDVLQSDYEEASDHNIFKLFAHCHRHEHETDIEKINLSKDESVYLFKQNNDIYMISPKIDKSGLESYKISDGYGINTFGFVSKQKDIDISLQLKETIYNYNLLKPLNNDVIKK